MGKAVSAFPGMITVNDSGKFIWELLEQPCSFDHVVEAMTQQYAVDAETARKDATVFIRRLQSVQAILE